MTLTKEEKQLIKKLCLMFHASELIIDGVNCEVPKNDEKPIPDSH